MSTTRLVLVCGPHRESTRQLATRLMTGLPATAVIHHDLSGLADGVVRRRVRMGRADTTTTIELAHGCVSCTIREDLLPLLRALSADARVERIVLHLDPIMEPEPVCWALANALVGDVTTTDVADIDAVIAVVDPATWLDDATGDVPISECGLGAVGDGRTLAQIVVGQVEFADAVVLAGVAEPWTAARVNAVLDRLAPGAPRAALGDVEPLRLLTAIPSHAKRGAVDGPHGALLRGEPPLEADCGVVLTVFRERRPFHPARLHDAIDVLLEGVVRTRGRVWVASRPDVALWLESAGGGLRVGHAGAWLAAVPEAAWERVPAERRVAAALEWDPRFGDRVQELAILSHHADPAEIVEALRGALLTDAELADESAWAGYADPFGAWHEEPCGESPTVDLGVPSARKDEQ